MGKLVSWSSSNLPSLPQSILEEFFSEKIDRRKFLKLCLQSTSTLTIGSIVGCSYRFLESPPKLSERQDRTLTRALDIIFPSEEHSPGASEIEATAYLHLVLLDPRVDPSHKTLIRNGIDWLDEEAEEYHGVPFLSLADAQQERLIAQIAHHSWGERWISRLLSYIFEALLGDPVYGGNVKEAGWKWLKHPPGYPRPTQASKHKGRA